MTESMREALEAAGVQVDPQYRLDKERAKRERIARERRIAEAAERQRRAAEAMRRVHGA